KRRERGTCPDGNGRGGRPVKDSFQPERGSSHQTVWEAGVLGVCAAMGPVLACPWGICIDADGNVFVADWGEQHRVLFYPAQGVGWPIVTQGLSSPRGLTLLPEGQLAVSDSMNHCVKIYQYKELQDYKE
uniref:NHL repeat containing 4 n=1 Tax=Anabas testudineus TaxID=64144 RepID=A0A3Q1HCJ5_ANATE